MSAQGRNVSVGCSAFVIRRHSLAVPRVGAALAAIVRTRPVSVRSLVAQVVPSVDCKPSVLGAQVLEIRSRTRGLPRLRLQQNGASRNSAPKNSVLLSYASYALDALA